MAPKLAAVTVAVLALGLMGCGEDAATMPADDPRPVATSAADATPPAGFRWVGIGHAAIAVLESWPTNRIRCGTTPEADTVIVDVTAVALCASPRKQNLESVQVSPGGPRFDFTADRSFAIDGVSAQRMDTTCTSKTMGDVETCSGSVYLPSEKVQFLAESSTDAAEVDAMLARIRVLPDRIAVPGIRAFSDEGQERGGETYLAALEAAGFRTETRTELRRNLPDGFLLAADPVPGTMARPGDLVTVTVSGGKSGPADELVVEINSSDEAGQYDTPTLTDQQIREGATVTFRVGDRLWAYGSGRHLETLAGTAEGDALTRSTWDRDPNEGRSWVAKRPGTSRVTLTITLDGRTIELGTFTVVVKPAR